MGPQRAPESLFGAHAAACSSAFLLGHPAAAAPPPLSSWASWRSLVSPLEFPLAAAAPPPSSEGILALYCTPRGTLGFGAQIRTTPRHPGTSGPFSPSASSTLSLPGPSPRRRPRPPRKKIRAKSGQICGSQTLCFHRETSQNQNPGKIRAKSGQNPGQNPGGNPGGNPGKIRPPRGQNPGVFSSFQVLPVRRAFLLTCCCTPVQDRPAGNASTLCPGPRRPGALDPLCEGHRFHHGALDPVRENLDSACAKGSALCYVWGGGADEEAGDEEGGENGDDDDEDEGTVGPAIRGSTQEGSQRAPKTTPMMCNGRCTAPGALSRTLVAPSWGLLGLLAGSPGAPRRTAGGHLGFRGTLYRF